MTTYKDEIGYVVSMATGKTLTTATKKEFHVIKPDGTTATWTATESGTVPGTLLYTTIAGDLDQSGPYLIVAYVEWATSNYTSDIIILIVQGPGQGAATYTGSPSTRPIDAVRIELGGTGSLSLLTDDEIQYNLTRANNNPLLAAAFSAETIAGMYAGLVDKSMGGSSVSLSQKAEAWRKKSQALRTQALNPSLTPRASSSAPRALKFGIGQHDNISGAGSYSITGYI
jgi:hypothetical protein